MRSGGGTVTISGLSFGTDRRTPTAILDVSELCGSTSWTSTTTVACTPQAYGGTAVLRTAVSLSAVVGTVLGQFSFDGTCACAAAVGKPETRGRLRIGSRRSSHRCFVAVAAPCVSMSSPSNVGATGGGTITIGGLGFGGGLVVTPSASLGVGDMCGSTTWTSATTVACGPAAYGGSAVRTAVSVSAVAGTSRMFSFNGSLLAPRS